MKKKIALLACVMMLSSGCSMYYQGQEVDYSKWMASEPGQSAMATLPDDTTTPSQTEMTMPEVTTEATETTPETTVPYISDEELMCIDNTEIGYGQGVQFDENGVPYGATDFNSKYSKYSAYAVAETDVKEMYLTFDLGYENGYTEKILDTLKEHDVKAVFFVTGGYCKYADPAIIQRIIDEGHVLGNHGQNHKSLSDLLEVSVADAEAELTTLQNYIRETYNYEMVYMRPPEGVYSERSLALAQRMGYKTLLWSFAYADWDTSFQPDPLRAFEKTTAHPHCGQIMLLHAVSSTNAEILGDIINEYEEKGYTFTTPSL